MSNGHGGQKVKINFGRDSKGDVCFQLVKVAYPHSSFAKKRSGCGEWVLWEQKCFHRPAQAIEELLFVLADLKMVDGVDLNRFWVKYWASDSVYTRDERLKGIETINK